MSTRLDHRRDARPDGTLGTPAFAGVPGAARRLLLRRSVWHTAGLLAAMALAWLILQAYRQPDLLLGLSNLRLC